jgi:hypothetical protein
MMNPGPRRLSSAASPAAPSTSRFRVVAIGAGTGVPAVGEAAVEES